MAIKLLIYPPEAPELPEMLRQAVPGVNVAVAQNDEEARREIADADALYGRVDRDLLGAAKQLRWIQSPAIGLERTMFPELIAHPLTMTNPRGIFADDIADHVLALLLAFARHLHRFAHYQIGHNWHSENYAPVHLPNATVGIVGLGGIGMAVARRVAAHECRIIAVDARRAEKPPEVAELWPPSRLQDLLRQSDFVVIAAPETPETRGMFDESAFAAMKPTAYLINIGRGKIVRLDALIAALQNRRLAGAGLDVFEIEPLPPDNPLWSMENVIITPHIAGVGEHIAGRRHDVLRENLRRFVNGEPLMNVVEKERWF